MEVVLAYSKQPTRLKRLKRTRQVVQAEQRSENQPPAVTAKLFKIAQRLRPNDVAALLASYQAGMPSTQLARQYEIGESSVITLLDTHGVPKRRRPVTAEVAGQAIELHGQRMTLTQVGKRLSYNPVTILNALKRAGVPRRDSHGRPQ